MGILAGVCLGTVVAQDGALRDLVASSGVKGGLVVHLGCGDGQDTAGLRVNEKYLVQGLDTDPENIVKAREYFNSLNLLGKVTADTFDGKNLPYVDNSVNLLVSGSAFSVSDVELQRVLVPGGVAMVGGKKTVKPVPSDIDEWSHFLHGPDNNAVAQDRVVAAPKRIQWVDGPLWSRSHEYDSSLSAMVSSGGRIFSIFDEGPTGIVDKRIPDNWKLIARDAFNGVLLWKLDIPLWGWQAWRTEMEDSDWRTMRSFRCKSPLGAPRRLVAAGDRVYVTLGYCAPVTELDAATGKTLRTFKGTEGTDEIIYQDGKLVLLVKPEELLDENRRQKSAPVRIQAINTDTGNRLWEIETPAIVPQSLAMSGRNVVFHDGEKAVCVDAASGERRWSTPTSGAAATQVLHKGVLLCANQKQLIAISVDNGKPMWKLKGARGFGIANPPDLFVADGVVWYGQGQQPDQIKGYDPQTGELARTVDMGPLMTRGHHARCYRSKATDNYLFLPKRATELIDIKGDKHSRHNWFRGACRYGVLPCNGLLYGTPHPCFCYAGVKMGGFLALSGNDMPLQSQANPPKLEKGPAYGTGSSLAPAATTDWPMYRHNPKRSGSVACNVGTKVVEEWKVALGGDLVQPVIADGLVFTARNNAGEIVCLDAGSGMRVWNYIVGGRIDSSPSLYRGCLVFGSADGWVYCLRASDGALVWRFRAAPRDQRIVAFGQLESVWPVHGSVLIDDGVVYFVSGRSSFLDGGLRLYGLEYDTGKALYETVMDGPHPDLTVQDDNAYAMEGAKSDILVTDGELIYLFHNAFSKKLEKQPTPIKGELTVRNLGERDFGTHLFSNAGFLDTTGFNRNHWMHADQWPAFNFAHQSPKSGQLVVFDDKQVYSIKYFVSRNMLSPQAFPATDGYYLFADRIDNQPVAVKSDGKEGPEFKQWLPQDGELQTCWNLGVGFARSADPEWLNVVPVRVNAMVRTGNALITVGAPDVLDPADPTAALNGRKGAILNVWNPADGTKLFEKKLDVTTVFDGISAAAGKLFMVQQDGTISCWSGKD